METPAAAPSQPGGEIPSDIVPQSSSAVTWITFGGSQGESSGDFIQTIQRVAFQQGHTRDDQWTADYVSTCFNGDALLWYSELDNETQESWRKLRAALLKRYPPTTPSPVSHTNPPETSMPRNSGSPSSRIPIAKSGLIEVVAESTNSLGYLGLDPATHVGIITAKAHAVVINLPAQASSEPFQITLPIRPDNAATSLSNLGLALFSDARPEPDKIPAPIKISTETLLGYGPFGQDRELHSSAVPIATWTLTICGDSRPATVYRRRSATRTPSQRASAAIWKHDKNSGELRIRGLMDDDREAELAAYVQRTSSTYSLHVHRLSDMQEAGQRLAEDRVRFVFQARQ